MSNTVRQSTEVAVSLTERTVTYVANTMFQMLLRISSERNLGPGYITRNREELENGLFVWVAEQTLQRAYLEVFLPGEDEALEQWEFQFTYKRTSGAAEQPPLTELSQLCSELRSLPAKARYRVVVNTSSDASKVPGWEPTRLRNLKESNSQNLKAWSYGDVSVGLTYKGGK